MPDDELDIFVNLHLSDVSDLLDKEDKNDFDVNEAFKSTFDKIDDMIKARYEEHGLAKPDDMVTIMDDLKAQNQAMEKRIMDLYNLLINEDFDKVGDTLGELNSYLDLMRVMDQAILKTQEGQYESLEELVRFVDEVKEGIDQMDFEDKQSLTEILDRLQNVTKSVDEGGTLRDKLDFERMFQKFFRRSAFMDDPDVIINNIERARAFTEQTRSQSGLRRLFARGNDEEWGNVQSVIDQSYEFMIRGNQAMEEAEKIKNRSFSLNRDMVKVFQDTYTVYEKLQENLSKYTQAVEETKKVVDDLKNAHQDFAQGYVTFRDAVIEQINKITPTVKDEFRTTLEDVLKNLIQADALKYTIEGREIDRQLVSTIAIGIFNMLKTTQFEAFKKTLQQFASQAAEMQKKIADKIQRGEGITAAELDPVRRSPRGDFGLSKYFDFISSMTASFTDWVKGQGIYDMFGLTVGLAENTKYGHLIGLEGKDIEKIDYEGLAKMYDEDTPKRVVVDEVAGWNLEEMSNFENRLKENFKVTNDHILYSKIEGLEKLNMVENVMIDLDGHMSRMNTILEGISLAVDDYEETVRQNTQRTTAFEQALSQVPDKITNSLEQYFARRGFSI